MGVQFFDGVAIESNGSRFINFPSGLNVRHS